MINWPDTLVAAVDAAVASAAAGTPTTVVVEGDAGIGKSTVLDLVSERAGHFLQYTVEAFETASRRPFDTLRRLGVNVTLTDAGPTVDPVIAAQRLRSLIDDAGGDRPILLLIDDLQWADAESVDALTAVMSQASGDRLMLCVGCRPLEPRQVPNWRRWAARAGRTHQLSLTGLTSDHAVDLVRSIRPDTDRELALRLWEHTGGNPLYLRSLATEYDPNALASMRVLPAPADYADAVLARYQRLSAQGRELMAAVCVLGTGWTTTREAGAVSGDRQDQPETALQELVDAGLVEVRADSAGESVRPGHALVRAAVYQGLPLAQRRELHQRAAEFSMSTDAALEHRVAATPRFDDQLADALDEHGLSLLNARSYRHAAHFLTLAGGVTSDPAQRERRQLESAYAALLGQPSGGSSAALEETAGTTHPRLRALVRGQDASTHRRTHEAVDVLSKWSAPDALVDDVSVQYRIEALLAWTRLNAGEPAELIQEALDRAARYDATDPVLSRFAMLTASQLIARRAERPDQVPGLTDLPAHPAAVSIAATPRLAWRGVARANLGLFVEAAEDLTEVLDRIQRGLQDVSGGSYHAFLGRTQWFSGDWLMAQLHLRVAEEIAGDDPPALVQVSTPLAPIGRGDLELADRQIARARQLLARSPWLEACDQLAMVEVIRGHAGGSTPSEPYELMRAGIAQVRQGRTRKSILWNLHAGLAAVWAGALGDAAYCADALDAAIAQVEWKPAAAEWVRGLTSEAAGDGKAALAHLRGAAAGRFTQFPLYGAHIQVDHARIAHLMGDPVAAARSIESAAATYERLDAPLYSQRVAALQRGSSDQVVTNTLNLSERERDVLTLVTRGMSYKQIARDLFITQSTVSYHLGRIYAKADVASRHDLTQLVRADPGSFGIAQPA